MMTFTKNARNFTIASGLMALISFGAACDDGLVCGEGTVEQDGRCVATWTCDPGTVPDLESGLCVPACAADQYFDGSVCQPVPECAAGTRFDEATAACVPDCAEGQYWDGDACRLVPICSTGTALDPQTGTCMPDGSSCAPGTTYDETSLVCRPDATACGEGTHPGPEGDCVPNVLPAPDVNESAEPDGVAAFTLPAEGEQVSLGGVVDLPQDLNDDGYADQDWDVFAFSAQAGDYLRIHATSESACLPAFYVTSEVEGYLRASVNPLGVDNSREIYLPTTGNYLLWLNDIGPALANLFGIGALPVGGDDFSYYVTVERLPAPTPQVISSLPDAQEGNLSDGQLAFFRIEGINAKEILAARSAGQPVVDASSDLWSTLMIFGPDGQLRQEIQASWFDEDATAIFAADSDGAYLLVQDFLLSTGPNMDYSLSMASLPVEDCTATNCSGGSLAEGAFRILRWDISLGDFFVFSCGLPAGAEGRLRADLLASDLSSLTFCTAGAEESCWRHHYAQNDTWIYVWLHDSSGVAQAAYDFENLLYATPALTPDTASGTLAAVNMPANSLTDGGLARLDGTAGQVLWMDELSGNGNWSDPLAQLFKTDLLPLGPALDTESADLDALSPSFAWLRESETVFLRWIEEGVDLTGADWHVTPWLLTPMDLGALSTTPIDVAGADLQTGPGVALFRIEATNGTALRVLAGPEPGADLQPEIWLLARGNHYQSTWYSRVGNDELGRLGQVAATAAGETAQLDTTAPYDGELLILVRNINTTGDTDVFDLVVSQP